MARSSQATVGARIEWTTIPVWYLYTGGIVIFLLVSVGGFFTYQAFFGPKNRALKAIAKAESLFDKAGKVAKPGEHDKILSEAEAKLTEANEAAGTSSWRIATTAAEASQSLSNEILESVEAQQVNVAYFKRAYGNVEVKRANSTQWLPASLDTPLGPNDLVRTDANSRAEVVFPNGTKLEIEPSSLLQIMRPKGKKESRTSLDTGGAVIQTGDIGSNILETPGGTSISIGPVSLGSVDADRESGRTSVNMDSGSATVEHGQEKVKITSQETVTVSPEKGIGQVETLPERPKTPSDQLVFESKKGEASLAILKWAGVSDATKYIVELATDSLLVGKSAQRFVVTKPTFRLEGYPNDDYFWRVTAINAAKHKSLPSPTSSFRIGPKGTKPMGVREVPIPPLAIDSIMPVGANLILKGHTEPNVSISVDGEGVDIKADGSFHSLTTLHKEGRNDVLVIARNALGGERRVKIIVRAEYF